MGRDARINETRREMGGPFQSPKPSPVPIIGQPFTIRKLGIPVNVELTCNCGGGHTLAIVNSTAVTCPACRHMYNAHFNPQTGQIEMAIGQPAEELIT